MPIFDLSLSTKTSVMIRWNSVTAADGLETDGYRLYMNTFNGGNASLVYDGSTLPLKLYYNVTGLLTG
jgi:hypothetical protein